VIMPLFFSAEAKEHSAPAAQAQVDSMQKELQRMKDTARLRARHGQQLTDAQVDEFLAEEADMVIRKAKAKETKELIRRDELKRKNDLEAAAVEYVRDRRILIDISGNRVTTIGKDLSVPCPACGASIYSIGGSPHGYLLSLVQMWFDASDKEKAEGAPSFIVRSASNPLSDLCGAPMIMTRIECPGCKAVCMARIQLVVL